MTKLKNFSIIGLTNKERGAKMSLTNEEKHELLLETISLLEFELENTELPHFIKSIKQRQLKTAVMKLEVEK